MHSPEESLGRRLYTEAPWNYSFRPSSVVVPLACRANFSVWFACNAAKKKTTLIQTLEVRKRIVRRLQSILNLIMCTIGGLRRYLMDNY